MCQRRLIAPVVWRNWHPLPDVPVVVNRVGLALLATKVAELGLLSMTDPTVGRACAAVPDDVFGVVSNACVVTVLTGAGMSAESGIPTFRDPVTGWWSRYDPSELATAAAFQADPALVWGWYQWRRGMVARAAPNAGHVALARWQRLADVTVRIITQNVDDLHERAGAVVQAHLHGDIMSSRCFDCNRVDSGRELPSVACEGPQQPPRCAACGGWLRPNVVWFGESLDHAALSAAVDQVVASDVVVSVGTSAQVYPAAGLADLAVASGIPVVVVNPTAGTLRQLSSGLEYPGRQGSGADQARQVGGRIVDWQASAAAALPALVDAVWS